ncbi:MAG: 4-hydroxy-3-methylbut-2-en-1-yl diphosphate synthase [Chloroflexi bacterium RBG_13_54_8]|nr:MAG: 4-hydroxy-3-methylbut-2-en-1-yl diphosphate synthase [Chloroflexi bacterium RBG_13_54_8]
MMRRRASKPVRVGGITVGGGAPVVVQSMTKTDTRDVRATVNQIRELEEYGCEIVRIAVPDEQAAQALSSIKRGVRIPIIADIHFDYRLALESLKAGIDGLRLNPGNISEPEQIAAVVKAAKPREVPIRVGVNAGSLPESTGPPTSIAERMVQAALEQVHLLENLDFDLIKISLKAFDVPTSVEAYQLMAQKVAYPLHLGITEAGLPGPGVIRSALGIGILLYLGIGDTLRVSLTADPKEEVRAAYEILKGLNLRQRGPILISCPTCGRCEVDLVSLARNVEERLARLDRPVKIAVMGCVVNGPGEARDADVGLACGKGRGAIFRKGEVVGTLEEADFLEGLMSVVQTL